MPELPDVEVYRRYLDATALHQPIDRVEVDGPRLLRDSSPHGLGRRLKGRSFDAGRRHGKYLFATLDGGDTLVLHFGMTGRLDYARKPDDPPPHTACLFVFTNGARLAYVASRKLGRIAVAESPAAFVDAQALGPDALAIERDAFVEAGRKRRGGVKSWLTDQQRIAGIGNVYADEILYHAGIHPQRSLPDLDDDELRTLHRVMREVLEAAIAAGADPERMPADFLLPHRRKGGSCPGCRSRIRKLSVSGRTSWYCPACQPR